MARYTEDFVIQRFVKSRFHCIKRFTIKVAEHSFIARFSLSVMMPMQRARNKHGADTALILFRSLWNGFRLIFSWKLVQFVVM